jgi:hypothetical protein
MISAETEFKYFYPDFIKNCKNQKVGFLKQVYYLFKRSLLYNLRNPKGFLAMILISVLNGLLYSTVFGGIGSARMQLPDITGAHVAENQKIQQNYIGLVFFACLDAFMTPSLF